MKNITLLLFMLILLGSMTGCGNDSKTTPLQGATVVEAADTTTVIKDGDIVEAEVVHEDEDTVTVVYEDDTEETFYKEKLKKKIDKKVKKDLKKEEKRAKVEETKQRKEDEKLRRETERARNKG